MATYYCPKCERYVTGKKIFHDVAFVLLCLFVWVPGIIVSFPAVAGSIMAEPGRVEYTVIWVVWMVLPVFYTFYHMFVKTPRCPICNSKLRKGTESVSGGDYRQESEQQEKLNSPEPERSIHMSDQVTLQAEKEQLEQVIEDLKRTHLLEIKELEDNISELKSSLKVKGRIQEVVHAEHTLGYFPAVVLKVLAVVDPSKRFSEIYLKMLSFINYGIVCGIGVLINMYILLTLAKFVPLWIANCFAILVAWVWNWNFTVGPLGYLFGLSPKRRKEKKV